MKNYLQLFAFIAVFAMANLAIGQTIQVIDIHTEKGVSNVHFTINGVTGVSDVDGKISYTATDTSILTLSHLQYGVITLTADERKAAEKAGAFKMIAVTLELQPMTVLDKMHDEEDAIPMKTEDKLTHDAGAFLHQLPEINVIKKSGSYGFDPVLRGMKYERLNIVIDGVQTAHAACPNRMDPPISQIPMNTIETVEILKGPYSLRYGSSFGGTLNFISKGVEFGAKNPYYGRASTSYESNGSIMRGEALVGMSKEKFTLELHGAYSEGSDYTDGAGNVVKSAFSRVNFGGQLGYKINDKNKVSFKATANIAKDVDFPSLPMDLRSDDTYLFQLKHAYEKSTGTLRSWNTSVYSTTVEHVMDNLTKDFPIRMVNAVTNASTNSYGGRTEGKFVFNKSIVYAGLDMKSERADGERIKTTILGANEGLVIVDNIWQGGQVTNTGAFAEYQRRIKKYSWMVTGRVDYNQATANDIDTLFPVSYESMNSTNINFSLSTGISRDISKKSTLGLWIGGASRNGGVTEKFMNFVPVGVDPYEMIGNPNLAPESNYEVDLKYDVKAKNSALSVTLFGSYIVDYISSTIRTDLAVKTPSSPGVREYNNVGDANLAGGELAYTQKIPLNMKFRISAAYTYAENITTGEALPEIAPFDSRFILMGSYMKSRLQPQIVVRYVAEQDRISTSFGEDVTPSFALMDLAVSYKAWEKWAFSAGVKNIFDEAYYEHLSRMATVYNPPPTPASKTPIYNPGRSMYATVSFKF